MTLKEKLANQLGFIDYGIGMCGNLGMEKTAFIKGFDMALILAAKKVDDYGTGYGAMMDSDLLLQIGEEEVEND